MQALSMKGDWARQVRTAGCRSQSPVPYRLAMAQNAACHGFLQEKGWVSQK